jgi:hypothetical protein
MSVLPVETNPYIIQHIEHTQQEKEIRLASHLLEVECVYSESKVLRDEVFNGIRIFCAEHRIAFSLRPFNSEAFVQDREYITKLPAFHIYYKDEYEKSFYPNEDVAKEIVKLLRFIKQKPANWKWFSLPTIKVWKWKSRRIASSSTF